MTVAYRILRNVAIGAALVIAVVSAVTYRLVYQAAEQRTVEHLNTYVAERTRREEASFRTIYSNLEVVRGQFLSRDDAPPYPDVQARWDKRFMLYPDGAWRNREEFFGPRTYSNLWLHKNAPLTPLFQNRVLRSMEVCEEMQRGWIDSFSSLYFIFPGPATMGYDPRIARWAWQTPGDYDLDKEEWVKDSQPERNPSRGFVWTGLFVDPPSGQPFVTVQLPVDKDGAQIATVAHDTHINVLFNEITKSDFPGATHLIFRPDGRLIVHPALREKILASGGALTAAESGDPALASLYQLCVAHQERQFSGYEPVGGTYFSASRLPAAEWYFVTEMPRSEVARQAIRSAQWVWISGLASLGLLAAVFAGILRREVTRPLAALTRAARAMSAGERDVPIAVNRHDELGELASSFREMVAKVAARESELHELNLTLEGRVAARTAELEVALAKQTELANLKTEFVSIVSHEFRTPLGVILSAADVLDGYFERLPPEKRARHLKMIQRSTKNLANLIDEVLVLSRVEEGRMQFAPEPIDLESLCRSLCGELSSATNGACPICFTTEGELAGAVSDEALLRHILCNLLSNAVKYSEPGTTVDFSVRRDGANAVLTVRDRGIGIPEEDQAKLFTSFTRGSNVGVRPGTGLGLVVVQRCVVLHGGELGIASTVGQGTTVTVKLPAFSQPQ